MKIKNGVSKSILRKVLYRHVPKELIERPKMGFGVPVGAWLRKELRPLAEEYFSEQKLKQDGFFDAEPIRKMWQEHLSGKRNFQYQLWPILMFGMWLDKNK